MPRILVFQHIDLEHPGIFREFLAADDVAWQAVELDAGEPIPDLSKFDGLWVMGGPMNVWEEDQYPWLVPEKVAIEEAVLQRQLPCGGAHERVQSLGEMPVRQLDGGGEPLGMKSMTALAVVIEPGITR